METDPRYPIGRFNNADYSDRAANIATITQLPAEISAAVGGLGDAKLDTPYRDGGWTLRQTVHHVADSHLNSLIRFKLALTEDVPPTIVPYQEDRWAELGDSKLPVDTSLKMIEGIHTRWQALLESMSEDDYQRTVIHPETGEWTLDAALGLYAWHSRHHTAHIRGLRDRMGW